MKEKKQKKSAKKNKKLSVCVFCGASDNVPKLFIDMATNLGERLAKQGYTTVYGGANNGCMGAVADGALSKGGKVIGVFPDVLLPSEVSHKGLSELVVMPTMSARKAEMYELSDAFIILPGGLGTMDELFEIMTLKKLKGHNKPIIIFDHLGYWERLLKLINSMVRHGFAGADTFKLYDLATTEDEIFKILKKL
jgi:uncharacterized protein (TIGR00730 family)